MSVTLLYHCTANNMLQKLKRKHKELNKTPNSSTFSTLHSFWSPLYFTHHKSHLKLQCFIKSSQDLSLRCQFSATFAKSATDHWCQLCSPSPKSRHLSFAEPHNSLCWNPLAPARENSHLWKLTTHRQASISLFCCSFRINQMTAAVQQFNQKSINPPLFFLKPAENSLIFQ